MQQQKVLVVDDSDQRRQHLTNLLAEKGIPARQAASCEEALRLLAEEPFDLVLTETELPSKSGLFLLKKAKERLPDLQVILITHNASSYNVLQALRCGAYDFIVRPIDSGEILHNAVERAFAHSRLRHQNVHLLQELEENNRSLVRALKMMKALNESIERVNAARDIEDLFMELLTSAMRVVNCSQGFLALADRQSGAMALKVGKGIPMELCRKYSTAIPPGLVTEIARRGKPVVVPGAFPPKIESRLAAEELGDLLSPPGLLAAPLRLNDRIVGIVVLSSHAGDHPLGEHELHFLIQLSHHAALALEKAGIIHNLRRGRSTRL